MKEVFKLVAPYMSKFKWRILSLVLLAALAGLLSIATPYITGSFIDFLVSSSAKMEGLVLYCLAFLAVSLISITTNYLSSMSRTKIDMSMSYELNREVIEHMHDLSYSSIRKHNAASLTQKMNNDSNQVVSFSLSLLCNVVVNALTLAVPLVLLSTINILASTLVAAFGVVYVMAYLYMKQKLYKTGFIYKEVQAEFFGHLNDQLSFFKFTKDNGIAVTMLKRLDLAFSELFARAVTFQRISYVFGSLDGLIMTLAQIALFTLGGALVISRTITVGEFTILNSYSSIILTSIRFFFGLGRDTQTAKISHDRLVNLLNTRPEQKGTEVVGNPKEISVANLGCTVESQTIFNNFNYTFKRGKMYAIIGSNGCGKTTLVGAMIGENQEIVKGDIRLDETLISSLDMVHERRHTIGFCEQNPIVFNDTFLFNLTLDELVDKERLAQTLNMLGLDDVIRRFPDGQDAKLENTSGLSGGEKQKIAIARVLSRNKPIMIFDEPTSAMDKDSKNNFIRHLCEIRSDKILIVVTHDHDILHYFDEIVTIGTSYDSKIP